MDSWNAPYLRDRPLIGHFLLSEEGVRNVVPIPGIPICVELQYKRACLLPLLLKHLHSRDTTFRNQLRARRTHRNMRTSSVSICGILLILNLQLFTSFPIMSDTDVDMLKVRQKKVSGLMAYF